MRVLYLDCGMGAAGDMLSAALIELILDKDLFIEEINGIGIPGVKVKSEPSVKCGICGTHITVTINGQEEEIKGLNDGQCRSGDEYNHSHAHNHSHEHSHSHEHKHNQGHEHSHEHNNIDDNECGSTHSHSGLTDIENIVAGLKISNKVKRDVLAVYKIIAEGESRVHGVPVAQIHFHEVGAMDAIADITAVCLLMDRLAPDRVIVSPIHVGSGQVRCAHGILPVPAPATAHILQGVPVYGGDVKGELCTPTGAALLKYFAAEFGNMPTMRIEGIGYGMGKKDFKAANCVRALLGETDNISSRVCELKCNLDDMTPEAISFAMERIFEAGALEVYTIPVGMKKSRPGILLCVMCLEKDKDGIIRLVFRHTSTIGIRESHSMRYTLERSINTINTSLGVVRQKVSKGYGVSKYKYEYNDIAHIAKERELSLLDAVKMIEDEKQN